MKGIYNSNPPKPKYKTVWDVSCLIQFISSLSEECLSLALPISRKTVSLLALATFMRVSELASIDLNSIVFSPTGVSFSLTKVRKSQRSGPLSSFSLAKLPETAREVCPVRAIRTYIEFTADRRSGANSSLLFIGAVRPYKPVTGSTIGRWIKDLLAEAGVNTAVFSAHSTRSAASSAAVAKGAPIDSILKTASWASESTFTAFYRREVTATDMASVVLGQE